MDFKRNGEKIWLRVDKGEELLASILAVCQKEHLMGAVFHGIGACSEVLIASYIPEKNDFLKFQKSGMLDLLSLSGNVSHDSQGLLHAHAHALFSSLDDAGNLNCFGGHLEKALIRYTAEIIIDAVPDSGIGRMIDPRTGVTVWNLSD